MAREEEGTQAQVERLRGQIRGLEEQLQRLVRTEQRFYYAQREVARQLRRVETLNAFAIESARCPSEQELLRRAISTFFSLFDYDQAVAFLRSATGRFTPAVTHSLPGREGQRLEDASSPGGLDFDGELDAGALLWAGAPSSSPSQLVAEARRVFERCFGPDTTAARWLLFSLREAEAPPLGFILLRREGELGFHDALAAPPDQAFVELFGRHVATALTQFRLVEDLRQTCAILAEAQQQAVERERLAALGQLAAVVAHEVRNPVAVIFNSVAALRRDAGPGRPRELVAVISEEAQRLEEMVSDLLDFARPSTPELRPEPLEQIVRHAVEHAQAASSETAPRIEVEVAPDTPVAFADARMLHQAVLNLLTNSLQASGRGEAVRVRLDRLLHRGALHARLEVIDRGRGIAAADLERIFDPFFTTKAKGSGLGLAVVKKVVEAHRGELRVASTPGEGSTFTVLIPGLDSSLDATG